MVKLLLHRRPHRRDISLDDITFLQLITMVVAGAR